MVHVAMVTVKGRHNITEGQKVIATDILFSGE